MTRFGKLEETFDLSTMDNVTTDPDQILKQAQDLQSEFAQSDPIQAHDEEMDEIAQLALEYGKSLHDLGMNVEVKHAGEIFNASGHMLKIAHDARNAKMDKKLKLMRLELDKLKLDRTAPDVTEQANTEQVTILDRNQMLSQIKSITQDLAK
jgi:hypothetical protein